MPKAPIVKIPSELGEAAKALIAKRESICARCKHFNGVCTLVFPQVKGCRSLNRYRPGWLAFAAEAAEDCPLGRWAADQKQRTPEDIRALVPAHTTPNAILRAPNRIV